MGFWESILSLWGGVWDSLCSDFWDLGAHFRTMGIILALKGKCMYRVLMLSLLELIMILGLREIIFALRESTVGLWELILSLYDSI